MKSVTQSHWSKLTDVQRARIIAFLVQILLRQLTQREEDKQS